MTDPNPLADYLALEYQQLKDEQRVRITGRDHMSYGMLVSAGAVVFAAIQGHTRIPLLLLAPVALVLGWSYLMHDRAILGIGQYIREDLGPCLRDAATTGRHPFRWEVAHRDDGRQLGRKLRSLAITLVQFIVAPIAAVVAGVWTPAPAWLVCIGVLECLPLALLAGDLIRYANLPGLRPTTAPIAT